MKNGKKMYLCKTNYYAPNKVFSTAHTPMYQAHIDGFNPIGIDPKTMLDHLEMEQISPTEWHILQQYQSYNARLVHIDADTKTVVVRINGNNYTVQLKNKTDLLLDQMGMSMKSGSKADLLKAPMPGLILAIKVQVGEQVKKGDPLLVLEAMKMENVLAAPADGIIKSIAVQQGAAVEKNALLITFE